MAGAFTDSLPMFVLSGQTNSGILKYQMDTGIRTKGTQSITLDHVAGGITKYFAAVMDLADIRYHMENADVFLAIPVSTIICQILRRSRVYTSKNLANETARRYKKRKKADGAYPGFPGKIEYWINFVNKRLPPQFDVAGSLFVCTPWTLSGIYRYGR